MKRCLLLVVVAGCLGPSKVRVEPVKVEPIHLTIDVNLHDPHDGKDPAANRP